MKLYTPKQVAKILNVSDFTIRRYIEAGKLKAIKLTARNFRIDKKDLKEFIERSKDKQSKSKRGDAKIMEWEDPETKLFNDTLKKIREEQFIKKHKTK